MNLTYFVVLVSCGVKRQITVIPAISQERAKASAMLKFVSDHGMDNRLETLVTVKFEDKNSGSAHAYLRGWLNAEQFLKDGIMMEHTTLQRPVPSMEELVAVPGEPGRWMVRT